MTTVLYLFMLVLSKIHRYFSHKITLCALFVFVLFIWNISVDNKALKCSYFLYHRKANQAIYYYEESNWTQFIQLWHFHVKKCCRKINKTRHIWHGTSIYRIIDAPLVILCFLWEIERSMFFVFLNKSCIRFGDVEGS